VNYRRLIVFSALGTFVALAATTSGCAPKDRATLRDTTRVNSAMVPGTPFQVISQAPDTVVVRSPGVATDIDDTLGTQYGKHEAPRSVKAPECLPTGLALCIADTARTFQSANVAEGDGGGPDERLARWLVFAAAPDSMQVFVVVSSYDSYLAMTPRSSAGFFTETTRGADASWIRARFPHAGGYVFTVSISADSAAPYELRVAPVVATGASRPIGTAATLTIVADSSVRVAIVPLSMARTLDASAIERFGIRPGTYRTLLVRDTSYVACRLPCRERRPFTMRAGQAVTLSQ
jgi:hypothetical protein